MRNPGRWGSRDERQEAGGQVEPAEWVGQVEYVGQLQGWIRTWVSERAVAVRPTVGSRARQAMSLPSWNHLRTTTLHS